MGTVGCLQKLPANTYKECWTAASSLLTQAAYSANPYDQTENSLSLFGPHLSAGCTYM